MKTTQNELVYNHMKDFGWITPLDAFAEYGIMRLASRISDLRRKGIAIESEMVCSTNRRGQKVYFKKYRLAEAA